MDREDTGYNSGLICPLSANYAPCIVLSLDKHEKAKTIAQSFREVWREESLWLKI